MIQLITTAFATANIFLTIFLILVLLYWITVILGALDMNAIDIDIDTDIDVDVDVDVDVDADTHIDTHVTAHHGGGFMIGILRFFNFGQVPFMVIFSILILCMWSISVYVNSPNSFINPQMTAGWAMILLVPNFFASLFLTKFVTYPLVPLFKALDSSKQALTICGQIATLTTTASDTTTGQAKVTINGSVVSLSVRTLTGEILEKGSKVIIVEENKDERVFIVQQMDKFL
jgi:hypothetical protein